MSKSRLLPKNKVDKKWTDLAVLTLAAVVLPNLIFWIIYVEIAYVRTNYLISYFALGTVVSFASRGNLRKPVIYISSVLLLCFVFLDLMQFMSKFFGLRYLEIFSAAGSLFELSLFTYAKYNILALIVILSVIATILLYFRLPPLKVRNFGYMSALIIVVCVGEVVANGNIFYKIPLGNAITEYIAQTEINGEFESAVNKTEFATADALVDDKQFLLVMIESLGVFQKREIYEALKSSLITAELARQYEVSAGTVPFIGSTTAAEMREFCATRDSYLSIVDEPDKSLDCLPNRLRGVGYKTLAFHGFTRNFFRRSEWYPTIGFDHVTFLEHIEDEEGDLEGKQCGATFRGYCDKLMAKRVRTALISENSNKLVYWLTLNSHFPTRREPGYGGDCADVDLPFEQPCIMFGFWQELFVELRKIALDEALPPTDILIVGDHSPPLLYRDQRDIFEQQLVPYIVLKWK